MVRRVTCADYADDAALDRFAADVDVVTYEFENVPAQTASLPVRAPPVLPDRAGARDTQDRLTEKNFVTGLGIRTAPLPTSTRSPTSLPRSARSARPRC